MHRSRLCNLFLVLVLLTVALPTAGYAAPPEPGTATPSTATPSAATPPSALAQLTAATGGAVRVSYRAGVGLAGFIGAEPGHPIPQPVKLAANATVEDAARGFLSAYGSLFGLQDQAAELRVLRTQTPDAGRAYVRFQQVDGGIPVMGGELIVQMDGDRNVLSAIGQLAPAAKVNHTAALKADMAAQYAIEAVARREGVEAAGLTANTPTLWLYNPTVLGAPGLPVTRLIWQVEVASAAQPIKQLALVDAQLGVVVDTINGIQTSLIRRMYDNQNLATWSPLLPGNGPVRTEGQGATGVNDVDLAYNHAGTFYNFYMSQYNRDSIDGQGMPLIATARYCPDAGHCPYANAFWNGEQMVYGAGYAAALDVVAHEMTHGVTDKESHLYYAYQSGAINESFSDIWAEMIEHAANPNADPTWRMGEDLSIGAIRSLSNPPAFGDPDSMTSASYTCDVGRSDDGGVHTNSGVGNKAGYLIVNGGAFNGKTVTGIGINKASQIYYEVQTRLFTSASDYEALYNALPQACATLTGQYGITAADCQQVQNAVDAVAMNQQHTGCAATEAPVCPAGTTLANLFSDNLENPSSGRWATQTLSGGNDWYYPQTPNPYNFDATYGTSGAYNLWGYGKGTTSDSAIRMTQDVALPASGDLYLRFNHAYLFESAGASYYDGGVVEYSVNGGGAWTDAGPLFVNNGYQATLYSGNPLGARQAFGGPSYGYISSRLNLNSLAGQNVRFRFRIGTNNTGWDYGWFVDDISIYNCAGAGLTEHVYLPTTLKVPPPPPPSPIVNGTFEQGATGWTEYSALNFYPLIGANLTSVIPAYSGTWYVWLGGLDNEVSFIQQQVTVPAQLPYLTYYHWIDSADACGYDIGGVIVNNTVVDAYYLCTANNTGGWVQHSVNLGGYVGQTITFRIQGQTDGSKNSNLFVDDVAFSATAAGLMGDTGPAYTPAFAQPKKDK